MTLFEAARWAPSAANRQPWRFLYGHIGSHSFRVILEGLVESNQTWAGKASALIVVLSKRTTVAVGGSEPKPNAWHSFDAGAAWASLAFQAHLLGWAAHAMGGFNAAKLRHAMTIPDEVAIEAVVAVGKQSDKAGLPRSLEEREHPSDRLPLSRIVSQGSYNFLD
jgi:nitroreductase